MKKYIKILLSTSLLLSACAPKVEDRKFDEPASSFGPHNRDTDLSTRLKAFAATPSMQWQGNVSTAVFFEQAENLVLLGKLTANPALTEKGLEWIRRFYQQANTAESVDLAQSPFAALAAAQTQEEVQKTLQEVSGDLEKSRRVLQENILALGKSYPWPQKSESLEKVISHAESFTSLVVSKLPAMDVPAIVADGVREELVTQTKPLFSDVRVTLTELRKTTTLSQALNVVENAITKFEVELPADLKASLKQGRQIAKGLDSMNDAQDGLAVIVDIWKILTPQEQALYFKDANESLYDLLSKQDAKELECLRQDGCMGGIFKGIAKKLFILPQIKNYGLDRLQSEMNAKTRDYVLTQIETFASNFALQLPQLFVEKIDKGLLSKAQELQTVQKDYPGYIKNLLAQWGKRNLPKAEGKVPGFEVSNISISVSAKTPFSIQASGATGDLRANTAGAAMSANALLLQNSADQDTLHLQSALSQVNKLISIGGYRDGQNKLIPALLAPVDHEKENLDLTNMTASEISYRIPDKIRMQDGFHADENMVYDKNFSAASFAEQIKGLSQLLRWTADWKETNFDKTLGRIQAQELTEEIQSESLQRSLFPKDMLFALNIADVAVLLQDITKKATPVFLLTLNNSVLWADQYSASTETAIMAGIVDIRDGRKSNVVRAQDVAKFLLAITEFLQATEGVENTRSSLLLEKDAAGRAPLDALLEGRRDLKLLVVALANFISNQLMTKKSLVQAHYYLNEKQRANNPEFLVEEQVYALRALLAAWKTTELDAYLWSAQEIYFAMNKDLFNSQEGFYQNGDGTKLDFPQKLRTLVALQEIKTHLPEASRLQLEKISSPWLGALQGLQ